MYSSVLSNFYFPFWFDPTLVEVDRFGPKLRSDLRIELEVKVHSIKDLLKLILLIRFSKIYAFKGTYHDRKYDESQILYQLRRIHVSLVPSFPSSSSVLSLVLIEDWKKDA